MNEKMGQPKNIMPFLGAEEGIISDTLSCRWWAHSLSRTCA